MSEANIDAYTRFSRTPGALAVTRNISENIQLGGRRLWFPMISSADDVVNAYGEGDPSDPIYGFADRDAVHLHLTRFAELDPTTNSSACYLKVTDAEWSRAGVEGRLSEPTDTPYDLRESFKSTRTAICCAWGPSRRRALTEARCPNLI